MPYVYLSPSTQEGNYYVNSGTEEQYMNLVCDQVIPYLEASGITPEMTGHNRLPMPFVRPMPEPMGCM